MKTADPRVRKDGRCARKGCTKQRPIAAQGRERPCSTKIPHEPHVYWLAGNHEYASRSVRCPGRSHADKDAQDDAWLERQKQP